MKIHDIEYLLLRSARRFRGWIVKSYQKGTVSNRKILQILALIVLSLSLLRVNFTAKKEEPSASNYFGTVLSAQVPSPTPSPSPYPKRVSGSSEMGPVLAKAALVVDTLSSVVLYEKEKEAVLPPASTAKMMTALIALESYGMEEEVEIADDCTRFDGGPKMGLKKGEKITAENLLYGLLLSSASDAACALATHRSQTRAAFLAQMNEKAKLLGMGQTSYSNVTGLDEERVGNLSTAADILKLTKEVWRSELFRKIVAMPKIVVGVSDGSLSHPLINTNELLTFLPGTIGIKTGFTEKAGGCLVFAYSEDGREIIGVVLGSTERGRFEDARKIIDWVFRAHTWES